MEPCCFLSQVVYLLDPRKPHDSPGRLGCLHQRPTGSQWMLLKFLWSLDIHRSSPDYLWRHSERLGVYYLGTQTTNDPMKSPVLTPHMLLGLS